MPSAPLAKLPLRHAVPALLAVAYLAYRSTTRTEACSHELCDRLAVHSVDAAAAPINRRCQGARRPDVPVFKPKTALEASAAGTCSEGA